MLNRFSIFAISLIVLIGCSSLIKNVAILVCSENTIVSNPIFSVYCISNKGAAFSILENHPVFLTIVSILVLAIVTTYVLRNIYKLSRFEFMTFIALIAGILGNLSERILYGEVTDYIKLNFIDFPIFNFSDILITLATIALIVQMFLIKKGNKNAG